MVKNAVPGSGKMQGPPFLTFITFSFRLTHPGMDLLARTTTLADHLTLLSAQFGDNADFQPDLEKAWSNLEKVRDGLGPFEENSLAFEERNTYLKDLDTLQKTVDQLIVKTKVLAQAGMNEYEVPGGLHG